MAEEKEIFNILKDANGNGEAPDLREEGQAEGDAKSHAILPAKDASGNLQYITLRNENDAIDASVPGLVAKDPIAGTLEYLTVNPFGELLVDLEGAGNIHEGANSGTVTTAGSEQEVLSVALTSGETIRDIEIMVSSFKDCTWRIEYYDDVTPSGSITGFPNKLRTGAGQYTFMGRFENVQHGAGGVAPSIKVFVTQRAGSGSDFDVNLSLKSLAI